MAAIENKCTRNVNSFDIFLSGEKCKKWKITHKPLHAWLFFLSPSPSLPFPLFLLPQKEIEPRALCIRVLYFLSQASALFFGWGGR
jgi:hypothetical protein